LSLNLNKKYFQLNKKIKVHVLYFNKENLQDFYKIHLLSDILSLLKLNYNLDLWIYNKKKPSTFIFFNQNINLTLLLNWLSLN
jgi:hypothetical protein